MKNFHQGFFSMQSRNSESIEYPAKKMKKK